MKKAFFSHIQVCVRTIKEPYDDQYQECLSTLGNNEVQFKFETQLSEISKNVIFQKRDKLVHSPEANKEKENVNMEIENNSQKTVKEPDQSQKELQDLIAKTELQIYQFDKAFGHDVSDYKIFQELFEKPSIAISKKRKNFVYFNIAKSHTILNVHSDESIASLKDFQDQPNYKSGILPILLDQILKSKNNMPSTPSKLFEKEGTFDTIVLSCYLATGNKFYNLLAGECKPLSTSKEITKTVIENLNCLKILLSNLKGHILIKKTPIDFICYKIKMYDSKNKVKGQKSKITIFDFPSPFDKNAEKFEREDRDISKIDNHAENFIQPIKVLFSLLTNEKNANNFKDKFLAQLSSVCKYNSKICILGNLRSTHPHYHQILNVILLLNQLKTCSSGFNTLFYRMVYHQFKKLEIERDLKNIERSANENGYKMEMAKETQKPDTVESNMLNEKISTLEKENKRLNEELNSRTKENQDLKSSVKSLEEEVGFLKTKAASYLKNLNETHKNEKEKLLETINKLEAQVKAHTTIENNDVNYTIAQLKQNELKLVQNLKECEVKLSYYKSMFLQVNQEKKPKDEKYIEEMMNNLNISNIEKSKVLEEKNALIKANNEKQRIIEQTLSQVQNYFESEVQRNQLVIHKLQSAFIGKITILEEKNKHINRFNEFLKQVNQVMISKIYSLLNENEKNVNLRTQELKEMNEKFKDIKQKMLKKLSSKNEEIQKYASFFDDLDRRLGNIENIS